MTEWQPIHTAPEFRWEADLSLLVHTAGQRPYTTVAFKTFAGSWINPDSGDQIYPTHWMHLPEPPK